MASSQGTTAALAQPGPARLSDPPTVQSHRRRTDEIPEIGQDRRTDMGSSSDSRGVRGSADTESSADEETHMVMRGPGHKNYQSTQQKPSTATLRRGGKSRLAGGQEGGLEEGPSAHESWWARLLSRYGSIELENKGSVARDHLALERTFLAWLRTSLAFASIGIAITQLFRLNTTSEGSSGSDPYKHLRQMGKPLGATFLGISIVMLGVGFHRYFESQHWIIRGKFPASRGSILVVALITLALMITSLVVVVVVEPNAFEKRSV